TSQELTRTRDALAAAQAAAPNLNAQTSAGRSVLAFLLLPANRGAEVPTITLQRNAEAVTLRLQLEGDEYSRYEVAIKDADGGRLIWRSGRLRTVTMGDRKLLPVALRANQLSSGTYAAEVSGISARGEAESIDRYPFRVVLQ